MRRSTLARARWLCTHSQTAHTTRKWHRQSVTQMLLMSTYSHPHEVEPLSWCRAVLNFKGHLRNSNQNSHTGMDPHTHSHEKVALLPCPRGASQLPSAYLLYCGGLLKMFQSNGHLKVNQKCSVTAMFVWSYVTYCLFPQTNLHLNIWREVRWHLWSLEQKTQRCFNTSIFYNCTYSMCWNDELKYHPSIEQIRLLCSIKMPLNKTMTPWLCQKFGPS